MHYELSDGEIALWIEQGESLCIRAITETGDPVEISCNEAKKLANAIIKMVEKIENGARHHY